MPTAPDGLLVYYWQWGADVHAAMDEAFQSRFVPFWQEAFFLSQLGAELDASLARLVFGR